MAQVIIRITSVPKFDDSPKETYVFKGTLEDLLYKFGAKDTNPLIGYISKGIHYSYKFYSWNGKDWTEISDPRPQSLKGVNL